MKDQLQKGFYLENSNTLLEWDRPFDEFATESGAVWTGDQYIWHKSVYLQGLEYPLCSENGITENEPFTTISAYIGLDSEGLWDDQLSLKGFDTVFAHLVKLFGNPTETSDKNEMSEKSCSWSVGDIYLHLNVIEQHALKCYLTVSKK